MGDSELIKSNKMLIPDLVAFVDMKERTIRFDFRQLTKLIQNFSTYLLSDPDTNQIHVGPVIYQVGIETPLQPEIIIQTLFQCIIASQN